MSAFDPQAPSRNAARSAVETFRSAASKMSESRMSFIAGSSHRHAPFLPEAPHRDRIVSENCLRNVRIGHYNATWRAGDVSPPGAFRSYRRSLRRGDVRERSCAQIALRRLVPPADLRPPLAG